MNVIALLKNLKSVVKKGKPVPFSNMIMVDEKRIISIIDEIEKSFPVEFEKAKNILKEKEEIISNAKERAKRIVESAEDDKKKLILKSEIYLEAKEEADRILKEAREEAEKMREDAKNFVRELLLKTDTYLLKARKIIDEGIEALSEESTGEDIDQY
ncbi:MAG TPA: hypothetical protein ENF66_00830 [Firmicutes bacterium]|nr:hypothetical protein [Caldisericia bacterium]HDH63219.1 hypothetical protein [Bacillota bacterium]